DALERIVSLLEDALGLLGSPLLEVLHRRGGGNRSSDDSSKRDFPYLRSGQALHPCACRERVDPALLVPARREEAANGDTDGNECTLIVSDELDVDGVGGVRDTRDTGDEE